MYFVSRQIFLALAGFLLFFLVSWINLDLIRKFIIPITVITAVLCILTFLPGVGVTKNGASRWIKIGNIQTFQPSELVKLVLPFYLAHIFSKKEDRLDSLFSAVLPPALISALFFLLIYLQNNFSTAIFIAVNALLIFFFAGIKLRYFFSAAVILFPLSIYLVLTKEHRLRRFISFILPDFEPLGAGYQVRSSLLTIGAGGLFGKGFGQGTRKIASVPEIHSDFIFSAYAEECGLLGVLFFFAIFLLFTIRSYKASLNAEDNFRRLLGCGLVTTIVSQVLLNIAVVAGALPATGVPLPFFSAGGSSLVITLLAAGIIVNISRKRERSHV
jgi:cell division protein FtsW